MQILPLAGSHDREGFDCGRQELNVWLRQVARQHQDKGLSKTFVATLEKSPQRICGYYALTLAELDNRHLPPPWRKKLLRHIPGVRLGRLAVDKQCQGRGLGALLLIDALARAQRIYTEAGGIGLFVGALDEQAVVYPKYCKEQEYYEAEHTARVAKLGVWKEAGVAANAVGIPAPLRAVLSLKETGSSEEPPHPGSKPQGEWRSYPIAKRAIHPYRMSLAS